MALHGGGGSGGSGGGAAGAPGVAGKSAYQTWIDLGNVGTEADFIASLKGPKGDQGLQGLQGTPGTGGTGGGSGVFDINTFSATIPLTTAGQGYMPPTNVTGPLTFTPAAGAVRGALVYLRLTANSSYLPNFSAFKEWDRSSGYDNTTGSVNLVQFFYDGTDNWYSVSQAGTATATPASTVSGVTVSPSTATGSTNFTATVQGTNSPSQTVTWTCSGGGSINASTGAYTAPASTASVQTITVTATSSQDNTKTGTATVTIAATGGAQPTVSTVAVSPTTATGSQTFTAVVSGTNNPAQTVTWSITSGPGTINASTGVFTAPAATSSQQVTIVRATSTVDNTKYGEATVTVAATTGTTSVPRFASLASVTESGTGPYTYVGGSGTAFSAASGMCTTKFQNGLDGSIDVKVVTKRPGTAYPEFIMGVTSNATAVAYQSLPYAFYAPTFGGTYKVINSGGVANATTAVSIADNDIMRMERVGSTLNLRVSSNSGPFVTIHSWAGVPTTALSIEMLFNDQFTVSPVASSGLA